LDLANSGDLINFYSDPQHRRRGLTALNLPKSSGGLVLATARTDVGYFSQELGLAGVSILDVNLVEVTPDWHRCIAHMLDACLHTQHSHRSVQLLADFAGHVHAGAIVQLESLLRSATREWKVRCVTQYDARQFSEAIDVDALGRFGPVLFGDYYHSGFQRSYGDSKRDEVRDEETVRFSTGD
jgi:hypothetical protein